ncbi:MAG: DsbA family protein [Alphaproteobacteria bacterium]|nr:DsbA family protein [Alphaproteobacteria bacterium]MCB9930391.1 DsbA family protein [Alphaproteobacteria bacterium]
MPLERLIVYFDYKSPYAYLAVEDARGLAAHFGLPLEWRPYTLEIPEFLGALETRNAHQWRRVRYSYMDARRIANERGLIVRGPQKIFNSRVAHIGALYAQDQGVFDAYHDQVFERFFKRELDIEDPAAIAAVLAACGAADAGGFAAFLDGEGEQRYRQGLTDAEEAGVFGVPTFVVNGELFWGSDRIDMVHKAIARELAA